MSCLTFLLFVFLFPVGSTVILDELSPIQHFHSLLTRQIEKATLELQPSETFLWSNGNISILGNLTLHQSQENERILAIEKCVYHFKNITCADDYIQIIFNDGEHYMHVREVWNWVNDDISHNVIVVVGRGHCGWNAYRTPFNISSATFNDNHKTVSFLGSSSEWQSVARIYDLHVIGSWPEHSNRRRTPLNIFKGIQSAFQAVTSAVQGAFTTASSDIASVAPSIATQATSVFSEATSKIVGAESTVTSAVIPVATSIATVVTSEYNAATSVVVSDATAFASDVKAFASGVQAGGISIPLNMSVPSHNFTFSNGGLNVSLDCSKCYANGVFELEFHGHGNYSNFLNGDLSNALNFNITFRPQNVSVIMEPVLTMLANITATATDEQQLSDMPIYDAGGIQIPNIFSFGPHAVVSFGHRTSGLVGSSNMTGGSSVSIPNYAIAQLLLELPLPHATATGWHDTQVSHVPFTLDAQLEGDLQLYASIDLQLQASALNHGFDAFLALQPFIGANFSTVNCTNPPLGLTKIDCFAQNKNHLFKVNMLPSVGGYFMAGAAKMTDQASPVISTKFASVDKVLPSTTFAFGPKMSITPSPTSGKVARSIEISATRLERAGSWTPATEAVQSTGTTLFTTAVESRDISVKKN